jgi:hypothetical protein
MDLIEWICMAPDDYNVNTGGYKELRDRICFHGMWRSWNRDVGACFTNGPTVR